MGERKSMPSPFHASVSGAIPGARYAEVRLSPHKLGGLEGLPSANGRLMAASESWACRIGLGTVAPPILHGDAFLALLASFIIRRVHFHVGVLFWSDLVDLRANCVHVGIVAGK